MESSLLPALIHAQTPLQLNVPYSCQDGVTRTITRCEKNARAEVCFWREERNGQADERYNVRGLMDGWLATCKVQAAPTPAAPAPQPVGQVSAPSPDQALNPPYLAGMPSSDTVKREIRGADAVDTLARQVAVLNVLPRLVLRIRMAPGRSLAATPDEQQLLNVYSLASYELSQSYVTSVAPDAAKIFQQAVGRYELDAALNNQTFALLSAATRAEFQRANAGANAKAQAGIDQQRRENQPAPAQPPAAPAGAPGLTGFAGINSPGGAAIRRCLELGGSNGECLGQGFTTDLLGLTGFSDSPFSGPSGPASVRIGGTYTAAAGLSIGFTSANANAHLSGCGKLESDTRVYSVTRRGNQLQVEIQNTPIPLVILLGPDGTFTGPAAFAVTGNVIVGYDLYWVETRAADGSVVPGSGREERRPIYESRTERCGFASLRATASTDPETSLTGLLAGGLDGQAAERQSGFAEAPAGPRMSGTYAGAGGLQLEFRPTWAVIDCGEAHARLHYAVENRADGIVVTVRNGTVPLTLTLGPDGTLRGSGTVEVAGRVVTGTSDSGATFAPRTARCAVGVLTAR